MVDFDLYRVFYYVAKYKNYTRAAAVLMTSQPMVTRNMKQLENALGCRLFIRQARGVALTQEGERLLGQIAPAVEAIVQAEEQLTVGGQTEGSVYLGATETALRGHVLDRLEQFCRACPSARLKLSVHSTPQLLQALRAGQLDLAAVTSPVEVSRPLKSTVIGQVQDILVAGAAYRHLCGQTLTLASLEAYPLVSLGKSTATYTFYEELYARYRLRFSPDIELNSADLIVPVVSRGLGVAFVPQQMVEAVLRRGEIVRLQLAEPIPPRQVCLVRDLHRPLNLPARRLRDILLDSAHAQLPEQQED